MTKPRRPTVKVQRLPHAGGLPLPAYQTPDAAGMDLVAALADDAPLTLGPGASARVPTGLILQLPRHTEGQVRPRSGLAAKHGITVLNAPGTIDSDYRGEVAVLLINHGREPFTISRGDRIAQLVVAPVTQIAVKEARQLSATHRGSGGFGSTGLKNSARKKSSPEGGKQKAVPEKTKSRQSRYSKPRAPKV